MQGSVCGKPYDLTVKTLLLNFELLANYLGIIFNLFAFLTLIIMQECSHVDQNETWTNVSADQVGWTDFF